MIADADLAHGEAGRASGKKIVCPALALQGAAGIPSKTSGPLKAWRQWADDVRGIAVDCGHYPCEKIPQAAARALIDFISAG